MRCGAVVAVAMQLRVRHGMRARRAGQLAAIEAGEMDRQRAEARREMELLVSRVRMPPTRLLIDCSPDRTRIAP